VRTTIASLLLLGACVAGRLEARYFDPHPPDILCDPPQATTRPVRLGHVTAAPFLRDRIVWRISETEVAFDDANRWAAPPDRLAADALGRALVARNGFLRSDSVRAATLDVHVAAFEVERAKADVVVRLEATLRDPSGAPQRGTFEARQVATIDTPRSVAEAAGIALADAIRRLGDWLRPLLGDR